MCDRFTYPSSDAHRWRLSHRAQNACPRRRRCRLTLTEAKHVERTWKIHTSSVFIKIHAKWKCIKYSTQTTRTNTRVQKRVAAYLFRVCAWLYVCVFVLSNVLRFAVVRTPPSARQIGRNNWWIGLDRRTFGHTPSGTQCRCEDRCGAVPVVRRASCTTVQPVTMTT